MDLDDFDVIEKPKTLSDCKELKHYAGYYRVSIASLKRLRRLGVDLNNESEVNYLSGRRNKARLLAEYRASLATGSRARTSTPDIAACTLQDSLDALRKAEATLLAEFDSAAPQGRDKAQRQWLELHKVRLETEKQIFEVQKLNSDSLPIDDVKKEWFEALQAYRQDLDSIPNKWSTFLFEKKEWEIQEILKRLVSELVERHLKVAQ